MTKNAFKRFLSVLLALLIVAAMTLTLVACGDKEPEKTDNTTPVATDSAKDTSAEPADDTAPAGEKTITVDVVDNEGKTTTFVITTSAETLADALLDEKLVEGDVGEYGLMITTVNGLRADYNEDGAYWGMFQGGEYMSTGASDTMINDGDHYELVYTKA